MEIGHSTGVLQEDGLTIADRMEETQTLTHSPMAGRTGTILRAYTPTRYSTVQAVHTRGGPLRDGIQTSISHPTLCLYSGMAFNGRTEMALSIRQTPRFRGQSSILTETIHRHWFSSMPTRYGTYTTTIKRLLETADRLTRRSFSQSSSTHRGKMVCT